MVIVSTMIHLKVGWRLNIKNKFKVSHKFQVVLLLSWYKKKILILKNFNCITRKLIFQLHIYNIYGEKKRFVQLLITLYVYIFCFVSGIMISSLFLFNFSSDVWFKIFSPSVLQSLDSKRESNFLPFSSFIFLYFLL